VIGDSISIGYTPHVKTALEDQALVVHNEGNAQDSKNGVQQADVWIGSDKWDVISFNFGLWDLCYRLPGPITTDNRDKVNGTIAVPLAQYRENLTAVATKLKSTGAKLVYQTTTVVPQAEPGRYSTDVSVYNDAAISVMQKLGIPVNDLQSVTAHLPDSMRESDSDVHYTDAGYAEISQSVTESIKRLL
jgi:lysophospholipase L1-like esterase